VRVAYDLRYAADHFSGIGTHAFELLGACLEEPDDTEYVVLWNPSMSAQRYDVCAFRRHPRVTWVERRWWPLSVVDPLRLSAWLRRLSPDVFLSPFYLNPPGAGCANVLTLHDLSPVALADTLTPSGHLLFAIALRAARRARGVLTSSVFSRDALVGDGGLEADRVHVVPLGVPRPRDTHQQRPAHAPDGPFALVVGENRPRKNLQVLAKAWATLDAPAGFTLVSAGRTHARYPSLESLATNVPATHPVRELGWTTSEELAWLYAHASVLLVPSRYEGFGFPLVEGFAAQLPVIAADIPTFREVGADAALYVAPDDPAGWAAAISRVLGEERLRTSLIAKGTSRATQLTYGRTAKATLSVLRGAATAGA